MTTVDSPALAIGGASTDIESSGATTVPCAVAAMAGKSHACSFVKSRVAVGESNSPSVAVGATDAEIVNS